MRGTARRKPDTPVLAADPRTFAELTSGTVRAFDRSSGTLTLQDGSMYRLPAHLTARRFRVGGRVDVAWAMQDGQPIANSVTPSR